MTTPADRADQGWGTHLRMRKFWPHVCTTFAAGRADEVWFDVRQPDMIGPAVGADRDVVAAFVVPDQHIANAGCAHFAERYLSLEAVRERTPQPSPSLNVR